MEAWLEETIETLSRAKADLASALAGESLSEGEIWPVYVAVEVSVFDVKLALGEDDVGRFVDMKELYKTGGRQLLKRALASLERAHGELLAGDLRAALSSLRDARNRLRAHLRARRKEIQKLRRATA